MTEMRGILGDAERCCSALCDYRPEAVQVYLDYILDMERAREDPCEVAACKPIRRDGSGGPAGDRATRIWDVRRAVAELRAEHRDVTAESVSRKLCPWGVE